MKLNQYLTQYFNRLLLCFFMLFLCGCTVQTAQESSATQTSENSSSTYLVDQSSEASTTDSLAVNEELPHQVKEYKEQLKEESMLIAINTKGQVVRQIRFPNESYSKGSLSPDGRYMLCKKDEGGAGEARWCDYTVVDLETEEVFNFGKEQSGFDDHVILDNNLIGYASWAPNEIWDGTKWEPIKLFDINYNPINIKLNFDFGKNMSNFGMDYYENQINGIGYDKENKRYILTYAKDLTWKEDGYTFPCELNRLGIAIFDSNGELIENTLLPEEYLAPVSGNLLTVIGQRPLMLRDNWLLLGAHKSIGKFRKPRLLMVNLSTWEIKNLAYYCYNYRLFADEDTIFTSEDCEVEKPADVLLKINSGSVVSTTRLPEIKAVGYKKSFQLFDIAMKNNTVYAAAVYWLNGHEAFNGIFNWDGKEMKLIHLYPSNYGIDQIVGVDNEGNCLILISKIRNEDGY